MKIASNGFFYGVLACLIVTLIFFQQADPHAAAIEAAQRAMMRRKITGGTMVGGKPPEKVRGQRSKNSGLDLQFFVLVYTYRFVAVHWV